MSVPLAVGIMAGSLILGIPVIAAAGELETRHRVAGAADSAALAAADALLGWVQAAPCEAALRITERASVQLEACVVDASTATVTVVATTVLGTVRISSRAGVVL